MIRSSLYREYVHIITIFFQASKYVQDLRGNRGMAIRIDTINDNGEDEGGVSAGFNLS